MSENKHPKSYNNPSDWARLEPKAVVEYISLNEMEVPEEISNQYTEDDDIIISEAEVIENGETTGAEDFNEVLKLTEYDESNSSLSINSGDFVVARYDKIDTLTVSKTAKKDAKNFVNKVKEIILDFKDVELTEVHKSYIEEVAKIQINDLSELGRMLMINEQMINNIVERINATSAEDFVIISNYNMLINLQIKLSKELKTSANAVPSILKRMRTEALCDQELVGDGNDEGPITEEFGTTQFNSQKSMLASLREKIEKEKEMGNENENNKNGLTDK